MDTTKKNYYSGQCSNNCNNAALCRLHFIVRCGLEAD